MTTPSTVPADRLTCQPGSHPSAGPAQLTRVAPADASFPASPQTTDSVLMRSDHVARDQPKVVDVAVPPPALSGSASTCFGWNARPISCAGPGSRRVELNPDTVTRQPARPGDPVRGERIVA